MIPSAPADNLVNVVVVDDSAIMLPVLASTLKLLGGLRVHCFREAAKAYQFIANDPAEIGLVVTDFRMPGMNGVELAVKLHRLDSELPVICVSGFVDEGFPANEFVKVMEKPFEVGEFHDAVQQNMRLKFSCVEDARERLPA